MKNLETRPVQHHPAQLTESPPVGGKSTPHPPPPSLLYQHLFTDHFTQYLSPFLTSIHQLAISMAAELYYSEGTWCFCACVCLHQRTPVPSFVDVGIMCIHNPHTNFCLVCIAYVAVCFPCTILVGGILVCNFPSGLRFSVGTCLCQ